jgi:NitT/TauT family transport system ATP-binding protein
MGQRPVPAIAIDGLTKQFVRPDGSPFVAIDTVDLAVDTGEFVAIVGQSGAGKSTLLNVVAGLESPTGGRVRLTGREVTGVQRDVGYVFQRDGLLPWKSVLDNIALPLMFRGVTRGEARERATAWVRRVGLEGFERHYPAALSGGMRRRAALAQALVHGPSILLLDEPFSALDVETRLRIEHDLLDLWSTTGATCLFVTHDLEEAIVLASRVVLLTATPARVKQVFEVGLPRPRHLVESKLVPAFLELHREMWRALASEVRW